MAPPGVVFLLRTIPRLVYPSVLAYGCLRVLENVREVQLPAWVPAAIILVHPLSWFVSSVLTQAKNRRKAAAAGAVIPPLVQSKHPFGISHLSTIRNSVRKGLFANVIGLWAKETGSNVFRADIMGDTRYFTLEPDHVKAILATQFEEFEKGPVTFEIGLSLLGRGVFNSDGDMWKFHRTMTRPFFNKDKIAHFDIFDRHAEDILRQAKARLAQGFPIDFQDMIARFTLDSATEFLFGHDVNSAGAGLPYPPSSPLANSRQFLEHPSNKFVEAFGEGQNLMALRSRVGGTAWRLYEFWQDKIAPNRKVVDGFVTSILDDPAFARQDIEAKTGAAAKPGENDTLLHHLFKHTQDKQVLTDEIVNLLVAGRDTTSGTLAYGVYKLAEHPDITERLRAEILDKVGPTRRPTYEDIRDMKYLRAFLNEVLRLYPIVPVNSRTANRDTVLPYKNNSQSPIFVPKGTRCFYSVYLMHRRTDLWGPDAGKFNPDRFIDERLAKYLTHNPYIFVPFNAGPRICLGQQFAYNEMSFFLVRLLQNFSSFTLADDVQSAESVARFRTTDAPDAEVEKRVFAAHLTMYLKDGLWVRMQEAPASEKL
ncbi:cytochrome P450 [Schizophyllum commune H4-8]|uniref:Cytochrome P450 n=1 Tax=Schizophyllum commune (strain H4-8 / FGSC 9210) TaxID=578458 RepID=D8QDJ6_SCHCM|nr:cytochrome P450 [Schizophyllum commune H4-8]KAI5888692.1 cytochrome P450 [Schizophyllum commune H4-8]